MTVSEHKTLIFTVCFILFFAFMVGTIPSNLMANQGVEFDETVEYVEPPERFDVGSLSRGEVISQDYANVSFPVSVGQNFYLTYEDTNDTQINLVWTTLGELYFTHVHWLFFIIPVQYELVPYPVVNDTVLATVGEGDTAELWLRCGGGDIPEVYLGLSYDNDTYTDLEDAWDDGELMVYVGFTSNMTFTGGNAWALLGQLLTFNTPNVHPVINFFISVPIWVCIVVSILYVLEKLLPF